MTASDDDYFRDGIEIFKASSAGQGRAALGGRQDSFVQRYKTLAPKVIATLERLRPINKIVFALLKDGEVWWWGESRRDGTIRVHQKTKSPPYLPVISSILVHEAAHQNTPKDIADNYVPGELVCRTLECLYYQDLISTGVTINSKVFSGMRTFKLTQADWLGSLKDQYDYFQKEQLIDYVLADKEYRGSLKAAWVEENLNYWGGPKNRWSPTLGYFVGALAASPTSARNVLVMKLMMVASDRGRDAWMKMVQAATNPPYTAAKIKSALKDIFIKESDKAILKHRIASWGLTTQPHNGLDCLP